RLARGPCELARAQRVHGEGGQGVRLRGVDRVVGGGVDDDVGRQLAHQPVHVARLADVEMTPASRPRDLRPQHVHERAAELAVRARHHEPLQGAAAASIFAASWKSSSVSPPASWVESVKVTLLYSIRMSGWWSAASASAPTRLTKARAAMKSA